MEKSKTGLIAAIVHELLKVETFASLADLDDAVKVRCVRLRIPYDADGVTAGIALVARTRAVVAQTLTTNVVPERRPEEPVLSPIEAARACRELLARYAAEHASVPPVATHGAPVHFPSLMEVR